MTEAKYGVIPTGFRRKTQEEIVASFEASQKADIRDDFDVSTDSVAGRLNGIYAGELGAAWEALEACYHGNDPDAAESRLLEMVCKLTGTFRSGSTATEVTCTCALTSGTTLKANDAFANLTDHPDVRFTPKTTFVAPSTGSHTIIFVAEQKGPIVVLPTELAVIATPIVGWTSIVNATDGVLGKEVEKDPLLRLRRERDLATVGSATVRAITANVDEAFRTQIENLLVLENDTDLTDANGLPPHSIEVLIFDGIVPAVDDDALAQVIYDSKAGAVHAYGTSSGMAKALQAGVEVDKAVGFSRTTLRNIYLEVDLTKVAGYVGDAEVKSQIATKGNAKFGPGDDVVVSVISAFAQGLPGVYEITAVRLGFAASPTLSLDLPILLREKARFDTTRIVVNATAR